MFNDDAFAKMTYRSAVNQKSLIIRSLSTHATYKQYKKKGKLLIVMDLQILYVSIVFKIYLTLSKAAFTIYNTTKR